MRFRKSISVLLILLGGLLPLIIVAQTKPRFGALIGHAGGIVSATFSPDSKTVLTCSDDGTAKIWEARSGRLLQDFTGHKSEVESASYSPDGRHILTSSSDGSVKIWDVLNGHLKLDLQVNIKLGEKNWQPSGKIFSASFSSNGQLILAASQDSAVKIWDVASGNLVHIIQDPAVKVQNAIFSPDGQVVLISSSNAPAKIWSVVTGKYLFELSGGSVNLLSGTFSPDGKKILGIKSGVPAIWDASSGQLIYAVRGLYENVKFVSYSPDGLKFVSSTSFGDTIRIWDASTGRLIGKFSQKLGYKCAISFSPVGERLFIGSESLARVWDLRTGNSLLELTGHRGELTAAVFSNDGGLVLTSGSLDNSPKIWDAVSGNLITKLEFHTKSFQSVKFSSDGKKILTNYDDGIACLWDAENGKLQASIKNVEKVKGGVFQFSPDGNKLLYCPEKFSKLDDHVLPSSKLWSTSSGKLLAKLPGFSNGSFSPDGERIVGWRFINAKNNLKQNVIFSAETGLFIMAFGGAGGQGSDHLLFSPDGEKILSGDWEGGNINLWNASNGRFLSTLKDSSDGILYYVAFSSNSQSVVTSSGGNGTVKTWDVGKGNLRSSLKWHCEYNFKNWTPLQYSSAWSSFTEAYDRDSAFRNICRVFSANYSPDGEKIITSAEDSTAKVWSTSSGMLLSEFKSDSRVIITSFFSPDGTRIFAGTYDGYLNMWDVRTGQLLTKLRVNPAHLIEINRYHTQSSIFDPSGQRFAFSNQSGAAEVHDINSGELLYSFFALDSVDYLIVDKHGRFDGTPRARKLLYFTCGLSTYDMEQVKDQLWVPNLVERILKGEIIDAKKLENLNLCEMHTSG